MADYKQQASELILQDLIDCLFAEDFFANAEHELITGRQLRSLYYRYCETEPCAPFARMIREPLLWQWRVCENPTRLILVAVRRGIAQSLQRIPGSPVYAAAFQTGQSAFTVEPLGPLEFMQRVADHLLQRDRGTELFLRTLRATLDQTAQSLNHNIAFEHLLGKTPGDFFRTVEQWGSLRDRPFHPVAKAKIGFSGEEYQRYMGEFGGDVDLNWIALDRRYLLCGDGVIDSRQCAPAQFLLTDIQRRALHSEMRDRGIDQTAIALPVHPWQSRHILGKTLAFEIDRGICTPLDFAQAKYWQTSSVRTLGARANAENPYDSPHHVKLPLHIHSLGASRYLPAVKMINGQRSERLIQRALKLDPFLSQNVYLCDETKWWAYMPENGSLFDEPPRHLSALVRSYPRALMRDRRIRLIPMATLGTLLPKCRHHFFDDWLRQRQLDVHPSTVLALFEELCQCFFNINLRMFRLGMLAEIHGQNVLLVWRDGQVQGLLLRDHDSLRLYVPWLLRHGLSDPEYRLRPGGANTLYHDTPEELLFYLQTLGVQVNLRAIVEALASRYQMPETELWASMRRSLEEAIDNVNFTREAREMLHRRLFGDSVWPLKLLIKPMLERGAGPGSMPFGKGLVQNPFLALISRLRHSGQSRANTDSIFQRTRPVRSVPASDGSPPPTTTRS